MNKNELVKAIVEVNGGTLKETKTIVESFITVVTDAVTNGEKVKLHGFGTLEAKDTAERKGVNPSTREEIIIPAGRRIAYKPSITFKAMVKEA